MTKSYKYLWVALLLIIIIAIMAGCSSAKKLLDKAERKDSKIVAEYARDKYPCTDILKPDTTVIIKDSLIFIDIECPDIVPAEIVVKTDTVNNIITRTIRVPVTLPVQVKYITKWFEDSAKLKIYATDAQSCNTAVLNLREANHTLSVKVSNKGQENWLWRIIAIILIAWQVYKLYRKIKII